MEIPRSVRELGVLTWDVQDCFEEISWCWCGTCTEYGSHLSPINTPWILELKELLVSHSPLLLLINDLGCQTSHNLIYRKPHYNTMTLHVIPSGKVLATLWILNHFYVYFPTFKHQLTLGCYWRVYIGVTVHATRSNQHGTLSNQHAISSHKHAMHEWLLKLLICSSHDFDLYQCFIMPVALSWCRLPSFPK